MSAIRFVLAMAAAASFALPSFGASCDSTCLEDIGDQYRAAYLKHEAKGPLFARKVRFTENNVEMGFPNGSWDTVTKEVGPPLTISDPKTGGIAIFTAILQNDTPGYLTARLKVAGGKITEVEHMLSTRRNLSSPPTPIGEHATYQHEPETASIVPPAERGSREQLIEQGQGYFNTLQHNTGEIRGARFHPDATRLENGLKFSEIEKAFKLGRYAFNDRVRREPIMIDEARGIVLFRGFIDHKGVLDEYTMNDGTKTRSVFREPQTWAFLEMFKVRNGMITAVESTFIGAPYYMSSPWTKGRGRDRTD